MLSEARQSHAVLHTVIAGLLDIVRLSERVAARKCLLALIDADPSIAHITLPLATHLISMNPDTWQSHLEVTRFVQLCRPRAWVSKMLAAVPSDIDLQAEYLTGAALEIQSQLWQTRR